MEDCFFDDKKRVFDKFYKTTSDEERWEIIRSNQHLGLTVYLDNDETYVCFDDNDIEPMTFKNCIGNSYGVVVLLNVLVIKCEFV